VAAGPTRPNTRGCSAATRRTAAAITQPPRRQYQGIDTATAHYNRGNALAKAGQYPQAIEAYDRALREQPGMADAIANRRAVEAAMKRQQQSGSQQGQQQSQGGQGQGQSTQPRPAQPDAASKAGAHARSNHHHDSSKARRNRPSRSRRSAPAASPQDAQAQQQADRAQRERMQRALQQARERDGKQAPQAQARVEETPAQRERRLANEAWLKRVPDDPGGLLRAKFRLEYERRVAQGRATP
jgi:Ca-activated chloride channel family protein